MYEHLVTPLLILGSDTIAHLDGVILEKPTSVSEAQETLARLSGRTHFKLTGVALYAILQQSNDTNHHHHQVQLMSSFVDTTEVTFATLQSTDIQAYVATGEPMNKAGCYGIQGMGGQFVQHIQGHYFTVRLNKQPRRRRLLCVLSHGSSLVLLLSMYRSCIL